MIRVFTEHKCYISPIIMSRRSEGLSGQATRPALTLSITEQHCKTELILSHCVGLLYLYKYVLLNK